MIISVASPIDQQLIIVRYNIVSLCIMSCHISWQTIELEARSGSYGGPGGSIFDWILAIQSSF